MSNLVIKKAAQTVLTLHDNGNASFGGYYEELMPVTVAAGELRMRKGAADLLASRNVGGQRNTQLKRRLSKQAVFPNQGLRFRHTPSGTVAELHNLGDLYVRGVVSNVLANPANIGPTPWQNIVYAAPGLNYSGMGAPFDTEYQAFQNPSPNYATRYIDASDFSAVSGYGWPFDETAVPINGLLRVPQSAGPFPLALFVHGNHTPAENSTPGYVYLLELLASHGILAASVDCNFFNGFIFGENDARAIVHLEHVRQFALWNAQLGHPLYKKVDMNRIMIVGHSRGGEGVGHASSFNTMNTIEVSPGVFVPVDGSQGLGPYNFALNVVAAIAPTDNQYQPVGGPVKVKDNYFIIHGSHDGDVSDFQGYKTYDRAQPIDLMNPTQDAKGWKALSWVYGANHNHFNSAWGQDDSPTINRAQQENVAKVYFGALAQGKLQHRSQYLDTIKNHVTATAPGWIPGVTLVSQYQDYERLFICHYEEDNVLATVSPPVNGSIDVSNIVAAELFFSNGSFLLQQTDGVRLSWNGGASSYVININPGGLPPGYLQALVLRGGQSNEANNISPRAQNFRIVVADADSNYSVVATSLASFPYPSSGAFGNYKMVMQTLRLPLQTLAANGIDINNIRSITLVFDQPILGTASVQGRMYFDEIQLSK